MSDTPTKTLLPINATPFERSLEQVCSRIGSVPTLQREILDADDCPFELLPWLAWSLGIDGWKSYWPESIKRARIKSAINVAKKKGTRESVETLVKSFGAGIVVKEWFEQSGEQLPYSFNVLFNVNDLGAQSAELLADIVQEVRKVKPTRSTFEVRQQINASADIGMVGRVRVGRFIRFSASTPKNVSEFPTDLGSMNNPVSETIDLGSMSNPVTKHIDLGVMTDV